MTEVTIVDLGGPVFWDVVYNRDPLLLMIMTMMKTLVMMIVMMRCPGERIDVGAGRRSMRHVGGTGRRLLHGVDTQPGRHQRRQVRE